MTTQSFVHHNPVTVITMIQVVYLSSQNEVSDHKIEKMLQIERAKIALNAKMTNTKDFSAELPKTLSTVKKRLGLEHDNITNSICCPNCFYLYDFPPVPQELRGQKPKLRSQTTTNTPPGTKHCTHVILGSRGAMLPCNFDLWELETSKATWHPIKQFNYQSFIHWLGTKLLRPEYETGLDSHLERNCPTNTYSDIWDGEIWKTFKGKDENVFTSTSGNLIFGLYLDWLNPHGIKGGSKSISIGIIFLICFNLPPDQRYKPHNLFIYGFTPTPHEPKDTQLNHLLGPLMKELQDLWSGVRFSKSHHHPQGRTIKVALLPLIGDTPALRKVAGLASHSANLFCAHCNLHKDNITSLDKKMWPLKNEDTMKKDALDWRDAPTVNNRRMLLKENGVRYSVLQELPYWMPLRMTTIDVMHTFILGVVKDFCVTYLGIAIAGKALHDAEKNKTIQPQLLPGTATSNVSQTQGRKRKEGSDSDVTPPPSQSKRPRTTVKSPRTQALSSHQPELTPVDTQNRVAEWLSQEPPRQSPRSERSHNSDISVIIPFIPDLPPPRPSAHTSPVPEIEASTSQLRRSPRSHSHTPSATSLRETALRNILKGKGKGVESQSNATRSSGHDPKEQERSQGSSKSQATQVQNRNRAPSSLFENSASNVSENGGKSNPQAERFYLTPEELHILQISTKRVETPSWLTRIPKTVGMPSAGTPKAAEWLILITVDFVLALLPAWVWDDNPTARNQTLISTTSLLISAINMVMSHKLSASQLGDIDQTLEEYCKSLQTNWGPLITPKPTLHNTQHMTEMIKLYGPPSITSCWPGERLIHLITLIQTNLNCCESIYSSSCSAFQSSESCLLLQCFWIHHY